jgi:hypothetical protein
VQLGGLQAMLGCWSVNTQKQTWSIS